MQLTLWTEGTFLLHSRPGDSYMPHENYQVLTSWAPRRVTSFSCAKFSVLQRMMSALPPSFLLKLYIKEEANIIGNIGMIQTSMNNKQTEKSFFINCRITVKWIMVQRNSIYNFCIKIILLCCVHIQVYFTSIGENLITTWNDIHLRFL